MVELGCIPNRLSFLDSMLFESPLNRRLPRIGSHISFRICKLAEQCILQANIDFMLNLNIKVALFFKQFFLIFQNALIHLFSQFYQEI